MDLNDFFTRHPRGALAFSGGVDSALLVWAAARYGRDWRAYYVRSPFQPAFELTDARAVADRCGLPMTVLEVDILRNQTVAENPPERCYHCKRAIFSAILDQAARDGYDLLIDGSNASDDVGDRPGMRALQELEVRSPLRERGLTKADVRRLSREVGLPTWDKPAYACLATRVPTGTALTAESLAKIEQAEENLKAMGLRDFRVRLREGGALVQVTAEQTALAKDRWADIARQLTPLFGGAALDETPGRPIGLKEERMANENILNVLQEVQAGTLAPEDALLRLKLAPFEDLGYAKVDYHRAVRQGVPEVIYGQSKTPEQIAGILDSMRKRGNSNILVTRIGQEVADYLAERFPLRYEPLAKLAVALPEPVRGQGSIVVATGGTSDMGVAEEAAITAEVLGNTVTRLYDVGVAGLHRLLGNLEPLMSARVVITVAGMEGALASVVGGLVDCPVIAVPTSVGYGASFGGVSALLSMLNSCASGVSVVNIDNGFGAGFLASRINQMEGLE